MIRPENRETELKNLKVETEPWLEMIGITKTVIITKL